ncbi:hypothetical protein FACS189452_09880 [Bacteroidia bacterium]|nr:hypothetical protein FACS189452_09880 [Bacteroidia bacterium]
MLPISALGGGWKDVGTVARAGTDYYYEYEGTAFNGWKTFVAAGTFSDVFGTAGITSADNLVFNFKMRDGGIDTAIVLKLRIQTPNNDYWYEWPVGEQIATFADNDWHTVTLPLSNFDAAFVLDGLSQFCIANANANPVVDDPSTDEDETSDGLKPHGVGKDLNFNVDNVRFEKQ